MFYAHYLNRRESVVVLHEEGAHVWCVDLWRRVLGSFPFENIARMVVEMLC